MAKVKRETKNESCLGQESSSDSTWETNAWLPEHVSVVIVGAGFSGIGMARELRKLAMFDFVVLERHPEVGGTWFANTYPGAACDVPSHLYSFSFAPNPSWSHAYSPQSEILSYLKRCATDFSLAKHLYCDAEVKEAKYEEADKQWVLQTKKGTIRADIVVWATGPLSEPKLPQIQGLETFPGPYFHSATWDHNIELKDKVVAVVGTGASAIQFVPQLQPKVEKLYLYQRSAPWVIPRRDRLVKARRRWCLAHVPFFRQAIRLFIYLRLEFLLGPVVLGTNVKRSRMVENFSKSYLAKTVKDKVLRDKLTPKYAIGCKRILISDDYYPAITKENVEVISHAVTKIEGASVVDEAGDKHSVDVIICGTGFDAAEPPFARRVIGKDNVALKDFWSDGAGAYLGSVVPGFPNFFMMIGPNSTLGHNSMIYMIESHITYVANAITYLYKTNSSSLEVRQDVYQRYQAQLQKDLGGTAWLAGGCSSWYLDSKGKNTTLWSGKTMTFRRRTRRLHPADYHVTGRVERSQSKG